MTPQPPPPYQPQPPQQPQYGPPQYVQIVAPPVVQIVRPETNGLATASLVLGIITAVCFATILGWIFVPILGLLTIIFGFIGLANAGKLNGLGRGRAIAGLILGFAPVVLAAIFWLTYSSV